MGIQPSQNAAVLSPLRKPGGALLISCYELGHQPLGLVVPAGLLEQAGFAPELLDLALQPFDEHKVAQARLVGISVPMHTALRLGVVVAERVRAINPECHICFYGLYAFLNADYLLNHLADSCFGGEFEAPLLKLVESLDGKENTVQSRKSRVESRPSPLPSRHRLPPLNRYVKLQEDGKRKEVGYVATTRGCKHLCLHCPIPPVYQGRFYVVPKEAVVEDIGALVRLGAKHITFADPDFLNGPRHALAVVRAMHEEFSTLTFDFTAKIEHLLKQRCLLLELRKRGCIFVVSAVESFNDTVLTNLQKGHTRADVSNVLNILRELGITLRPSLVPFTPWETLDSYLNLLNVVEAENLIDHIDPVHYTIRLLIPPGSSLLLGEAIQPHLGPLEEANFSYSWNHPDPRMDRLQKEASRLVERATQANEDSVVTFYRIKHLAQVEKYGESATKAFSVDRCSPDRPRPPGLTESWFCCAEPTESQLSSISNLRATEGDDQRSCCQA
jgi:radical SAM superfamily enzyme YgiQ (UPF0313 family)